jgi:hypothetical protein
MLQSGFPAGGWYFDVAPRTTFSLVENQNKERKTLTFIVNDKMDMSIMCRGHAASKEAVSKNTTF